MHKLMTFLFLSIIRAQSDTRSFCSLSLLYGYRVASCKLLQDKNKTRLLPISLHSDSISELTICQPIQKLSHLKHLQLVQQSL